MEVFARKGAVIKAISILNKSLILCKKVFEKNAFTSRKRTFSQGYLLFKRLPDSIKKLLAL